MNRKIYSKNRIQANKQFNDNVNEKILHQHCSNINLGFHFLLYQVTESARPVPIRRQQSLYEIVLFGRLAKFIDEDNLSPNILVRDETEIR